jgi:hypothetical protein
MVLDDPHAPAQTSGVRRSLRWNVAGMDPSQKRRALRYAINLPALMSIGRKSAAVEIIDAGFGGVFVTSDVTPALRQLVQLQTRPPTSDKRLSFHGMVVHAVSETEPGGHTRGVGIEFYAVDAQTSAAWGRFIRSIEHSSRPSQKVIRLPDDMRSSLLRRFLRHAAVLKVAVADVASLRTLHARDLSSGGMFVECEESVAPDKLVFVHITHPNHAGTFLLEALVESSQSAPAGVRVRFLGLSDDRKQAFLDFIDSGMDTESDVNSDTPAVELGVSELLESELDEYEIMSDGD